MFRALLLISSLVIFPFAQSFFDRFYAFGEYNYQQGDSDDYDRLVGGFLMKKNFFFESLALEGSLSGILKSIDKKNDEGDTTIGFKEAYIKKDIGDMQISFGREIIDLSTSKIYSVLTHLSPQTNIIDAYDRALVVKGVDGATLSQYYDPWGVQALLYAYQTDPEKKADEWVYLTHFRRVDSITDTNFFAGINPAGDGILGLGLSFTINDFSNFYIEANQEDTDKDYVVGFDYATAENLSIAVERVVKGGVVVQDEITNKQIQYAKQGLTNDQIGGKISQDLGMLISDGLVGTNYLNVFIRYPFESFTGSVISIFNMDDDSSRVVAQADFEMGDFTSFLQIVRHFGDDSQKLKSEFGLSPDYMVKLNFSINVLNEVLIYHHLITYDCSKLDRGTQSSNRYY